MILTCWSVVALKKRIGDIWYLGLIIPQKHPEGFVAATWRPWTGAGMQACAGWCLRQFESRFESCLPASVREYELYETSTTTGSYLFKTHTQSPALPYLTLTTSVIWPSAHFKQQTSFSEVRSASNMRKTQFITLAPAPVLLIPKTVTNLFHRFDLMFR